jgi:putative ABC transport system permease protein
VSPTDPPTFAAGSVTLALVALTAALLPARRAARLDPARTLRAE